MGATIRKAIEKKYGEQDWNWRSGSVRLCATILTFTGLISPENWRTTAVGSLNLVVVAVLFFACCLIVGIVGYTA